MPAKNLLKRRAANERYRKKHWSKVMAAHRRRKGLPTPPYPAPTRCENCGRIPQGRALHLDHDHETGAFRGWLCGNCNRAIGWLGDSEHGLQRAIDYLRNAKLLL